jgi:hypothetical protein
VRADSKGGIVEDKKGMKEAEGKRSSVGSVIEEANYSSFHPGVDLGSRLTQGFSQSKDSLSRICRPASAWKRRLRQPKSIADFEDSVMRFLCSNRSQPVSLSPFESALKMINPVRWAVRTNRSNDRQLSST